MYERKLYVITNRKLINKGDVFTVVEGAISGGADAVILREKDLSYEELLPMAQKLKDITAFKNIPLIINGNIEVAEKVKASGIHLSYEYFIKNQINFKGIRGVSVHTVEEAVNAEKLGANYILAGHVFETDCKKGLQGRGIAFIENICNKVKIPVIGIGGINESNIKLVLKAGASGVAVMSSIMVEEEPKYKTNSLKSAIMN